MRVWDVWRVAKRRSRTLRALRVCRKVLAADEGLTRFVRLPNKAVVKEVLAEGRRWVFVVERPRREYVARGRGGY